MEGHDLFLICLFIIDSASFLLVPSDAQKNDKTENTPFIIKCWHATPLQLIRRDALDERHHAAIPRRPNMSQARDNLSTVSLEAELVSVTDRLKVLYGLLQDYCNVPCFPTCT